MEQLKTEAEYIKSMFDTLRLVSKQIQILEAETLKAEGFSRHTEALRMLLELIKEQFPDENTSYTVS